MLNTEIILNYHRSHFEEIYFRNNNGNYIKSPVIKSSFKVLCVSTILFFITVLYYLNSDIAVLAFVIIFYLIPVLDYLSNANKVRKWKLEVKEYLNNLDKIKNQSLTITEKSIAIKQDGKETIDNWDLFTSAEINNDFIALTGKGIIMLPAKSMKKEEFDFCKEFISLKLKSYSNTTYNS